MSDDRAEPRQVGFLDAYSSWLYAKVSGRSSFRNPKFTGWARVLAIFLYPISLIEAALSPLVIIALAVVFDPWTQYFTHICALLAYGGVLAAIGYGIFILIG